MLALLNTAVLAATEAVNTAVATGTDWKPLATAIGVGGIMLGVGFVVMGAGRGIGNIGGSAVEAIARQPEAKGSIGTNMIIAAALIEGFTFFALIIGLLAMGKLNG